MRQVHNPVQVFYGGRFYKLQPDQWRRLAPQIKGLNQRAAAAVGREFLVREGLMREDCGL